MIVDSNERGPRPNNPGPGQIGYPTNWPEPPNAVGTWGKEVKQIMLTTLIKGFRVRFHVCGAGREYPSRKPKNAEFVNKHTKIRLSPATSRRDPLPSARPPLPIPFGIRPPSAFEPVSGPENCLMAFSVVMKWGDAGGVPQIWLFPSIPA